MQSHLIPILDVRTQITTVNNCIPHAVFLLITFENSISLHLQFSLPQPQCNTAKNERPLNGMRFRIVGAS